jgi:hypothetical protein
MRDKPASRIEALLSGNVAGQPQAQQWATEDVIGNSRKVCKFPRAVRREFR